MRSGDLYAGGDIIHRNKRFLHRRAASTTPEQFVTPRLLVEYYDWEVLGGRFALNPLRVDSISRVEEGFWLPYN